VTGMGGIDRLRARLKGRAPVPIRPDASRALREELRHAAALVPLLEHDGEARVLLTRRRVDLRHHAGQVSFPGGLVDPGEETLAAALREAREEIGLEPGAVEVLGPLDEVLVLTSGFRLTPWVGVVPYPYPYVASPDEVESLLIVPLPELLRPGVHRVEERELRGGRRQVHVYDLPEATVWGATARALNQLLAFWSAP